MPGRLRFVAALTLLSIPVAVQAELATERYAPAQLSMAQAMLERAKARAALGEAARAATLAWQARLDAALTWRMTESEQLRSDALSVRRAADALISRLAAQR
jgi:hypothetical protein